MEGNRFMPITKTEMVDILYNQAGLSRKSCLNIVDSFFKVIKSELGKGNPVMISGFGKWVVNSKRERKGRNPQTGEAIIIDARKVVSFKASKKLVNDLNT